MNQSPNPFILSSAVGWLELGNPKEALAELDQLPPETRNSAAVLKVEWPIQAALQDWSSAVEVAKSLTELCPQLAGAWIHFAYSARRSPGGSVADAWEILLPAAEKFPVEPIICFNLACYACQMADLDQALAWLHRALDAGNRKELLKMALRENDLRPLWSEIKRL